MSEVKVNKISPKTACGTVTLGDSGDTFTVPSGVTISNSGTASGFGSTGEVSWNTTKITADPANAVSGIGYFCDTTGAAFDVTLPTSPSAGNVVGIADYNGNFGTNGLTVARNGSNINGDASNFVLNKNNVSAQFLYVDGTEGWRIVFTGSLTGEGLQENFIVATGGTPCSGAIVCTNYKQHTFTGPGTFCVSAAADCVSNNIVDYVTVAGGGGGGTGMASGGGGAGAGGFRYYANTTNNCQAAGPGLPLNNFPSGVAITVSASPYPIVVGGGGAGAPQAGPTASVGTNGGVSTFSTICSAGGGGGGSEGGSCAPIYTGADGGSGGGGGYSNPPANAAGSGNTPPTPISQGNPGGAWGYPTPPGRMGGGGGGAIAAGVAGDTCVAAPIRGDGGAGAGIKGFGTSGESCGSHYYFSGGGGAQSQSNPRGNPGTCASRAQGGIGGGGKGSDYCSPSPTYKQATAGTCNTGGGGGGMSICTSIVNGGSGIVIIRYRFQ